MSGERGEGLRVPGLPGEAVRGEHRGRDRVPGHLPDSVQHQVLCPPRHDDCKISKFKCSFAIKLFKTKLFYFWAFNKDLMGWLIELWDRNPTCWNWRVWNISDITRWQWRRTGPCVRWSPRPSVTSPAQVRQWDTTFQTNLFMGPVNYVLRKWNQF